MGIEIPRTADAQYYAFPKVSSSELEPGDLVFFETYEPGPSHCGIYIGNGQIISNIGGVAFDTIESWTAYYGFGGWGWGGAVVAQK